MTASLLALALAALLGVPWARRLDPTRGSAVVIAEGLLLGLGMSALLLLALSLCEIAWSPWSFGLPAGCLSLAGWIWWWKGERRVPAAIEPTETFAHRAAAVAVYVLIAVAVTGYALFATVGPFPEFDFIANWGLKGMIFWEQKGVDWGFLHGAWYRATHADYPLLLPLIFDYFALVRGEWDDRWLGLLYVAIAAAAIPILAASFRHEAKSALLAALAVLACLSSVLTPWVGLADGPLVVYAMAGLLHVREGLRTGSERSLFSGAIFLGFAALLKTEGVALLAGVAIALAVSSPSPVRNLRLLWPAWLMGAGWIALRTWHGLGSDLAAEGVATRLLYHLRNPHLFFGPLGTHVTGKPLLWAGLTIAMIIGIHRVVKERFLVVVVVFQFIVYVGAYLITPHTIEWQLRWSWERLVSHFTLPLLFVALASILPDVRSILVGSRAPDVRPPLES
ncbi:MAG TPA: hypothetical protein VMT00_06980 [Thermoanaerobaculia bacterium]|nr:hypothetical protein [Thermoanaerobaculia bacterium]